MAARRKAKLPAIAVKQAQREFYLTRMPAGVLTEISYAAVRRITDEEGAVQRLLNPKRIENIQRFILHGGDFPTCIVLNFTNSKPTFKDGFLSFTKKERSAQLIDGQHRAAGLKSAIETDPDVADFMVPVSIYHGLNTRECADIFLSINTEQKPVPRSLVYDLYGLAQDYEVDAAASRARDLVMKLNDEPDSPYHQLIKLPAAKKVKGGIPLSSAVTALKPLVREKGHFEQVNIIEFESQAKAIFNFFKALASKYGDEWTSKDNAFMYAAGFTGAMDFFQNTALPFCFKHGDFTETFITNSIELDSDQLIYQAEVRGIQGKEAPRRVAQRLVDVFNTKVSRSRPLKI